MYPLTLFPLATPSQKKSDSANFGEGEGDALEDEEGDDEEEVEEEEEEEEDEEDDE